MSTQHTVESAALVTAARAGDSAAQDALVGAYLPLVYNIVGRALNGSVDVDDVVQDTMLRALNSLGGLRSPDSFRSWLVTIAMNQVRAHWQARQSAPGAVEEARDLADPGADFVDLTMVRLQLSGQRRETARATRWLEPDDRALLSLWWLECAGELTRAEVTAALEMSPQHTAVRVQRMKAQLEAGRVVVRALEAQPPCRELSGVLACWDGRPSALWRKRIARHARSCMRCSGLWSGLMPAEGLLAGLALVPVSAALLTKGGRAADGIGLAGSASPAAAAASAHPDADAVADAGAGRTRSGHRAAGGRRSTSRSASRRRRRVRRRAIGGAVVAACVAGGGLWYFGTGPGTGDGETTASRPADGPVVDLSATRTVEAASPTVTNSPSPTAPATKKPSPTPTTPRPTKRPSSPSPTPRPTKKPSAAAPQAGPTPSGTVGQVVALVNKERAKAGCGPLTEDSQLDKAALAHSDDMAARGFFDHTNPDGVGPGQRITDAGYRWSSYGENIAQGQQTPQAVMDAWMNSPGHRANILNCSFKNLGVGVHQGSGGPWWTQDFGSRL
ncbi:MULTISPECIES: sigma-70 family RNA polymerase sigma factor [unclassified Streptomyces]|uniref:sigma-70 family RNA polymerase sigma factor n=1 Tax=unclassified Streptomyces TaxID=2593676 RepID=UPI001F036BDB|nr:MULTISPECIES: sigma-70 family RNA polymerase sigma factor [unclassified Streptomyces]MCH0564155.1 sigma-70 family RNA polymerase sigma factor [Streptomyces sp. MUM 2J]MCH0568458.1 sigma-70 family RNA polymerase sigma factor [Streptomyces sp. MUM 136J]